MSENIDNSLIVHQLICSDFVIEEIWKESQFELNFLIGLLHESPFYKVLPLYQ